MTDNGLPEPTNLIKVLHSSLQKHSKGEIPSLQIAEVTLETAL